MVYVVKLEYMPDELDIYLIKDPGNAQEAIKSACEHHYRSNPSAPYSITCTPLNLVTGEPYLVY